MIPAIQRPRAGLLAVFVSVALMPVTTSAADAKTGSGAALYASCVPCHGEKGEGNEATLAPRLAGREPWYLSRQLDEFRLRQRGLDESQSKGFLPPPDRTQHMHPVVDLTKPADTRKLVAHILTLQPAPVPSVAPPGNPAKGRLLYADCVACHGKHAEGSSRRGAPRLTAQLDWYLFNQLRDFRMGWRGMQANNPHEKAMRRQLDKSDDALRDLTAYIVSLNPPSMPAKP